MPDDTEQKTETEQSIATSTPPATPPAAQNIDRVKHIQIEDAAIQTINAQIVSNMNTIESNNLTIEQYREAIRELQSDNRRVDGINALLRKQRNIFADSSYRLRQLREP